MDLATESSLLTPELSFTTAPPLPEEPPELPPEELPLPEELLPEEFPLPEELLLEPEGALRTLSPVSFAMVCTPTMPSTDRPFCLWKDLTAFSVISP